MKWIIPIFAAAMVIGHLAWRLCFPSQRPTATPFLLTQWEETVYSLDADEDVRFVPPPFSPQRPARYSVPPSLKAQGLSWQQLMVRVSGGQILFSAASLGKGTVRSAFTYCSYLYRAPDLELPYDLSQLPADGDWIVREEAPLERRMKALESILSEITGRKLAIDRLSVERDVVIARGKWEFHPSADPKAAQFYTPDRDMKHGGVGTLADSFRSLGEQLGQKIIDETEEPHPREVFWTDRGHFFATLHDSWRADALASLEKQTSLKFVQTRRVIPVWIVSEKGKRQ